VIKNGPLCVYDSSLDNTVTFPCSEANISKTVDDDGPSVVEVPCNGIPNNLLSLDCKWSKHYREHPDRPQDVGTVNELATWVFDEFEKKAARRLKLKEIMAHNI
jgi:hypothetical protein